MSSAATQLTHYDFPSGLSWTLGTLRLPATEIAARAGLELQQWETKELGPTFGFFVKLSSGRVVLLIQYLFDADYFRIIHSYVEADAADVAKGAAEAIFAEAIEALGVTESEVGSKPLADARPTALRALADLASGNQLPHEP